jgi:hypothetical protein
MCQSGAILMHSRKKWWWPSNTSSLATHVILEQDSKCFFSPFASGGIQTPPPWGFEFESIGSNNYVLISNKSKYHLRLVHKHRIQIPQR